MMTTQEILNLVKELNTDLYIQLLERVIQEQERDPMPVAEPLRIKPKKQRKPKRAKRETANGTLQQLQDYLDRSNTPVAVAADKIGVSRSALDGWLKGRFRPTVTSIAKIEKYLHESGHYGK